METYYVAANLKHNGEEYARGDIIDLDESTAAPLLEAGVIQSDPLPADTVPGAPAEEPETPQQPEVSGKPLETGEPSIDGRGDSGADNAEDIIPGAATGGMRALSPDVGREGDTAPQQGSDAPVEPDEAMTRAQLEEIAIGAGIDAETVASAPNKSILVTLINEHRENSAPETVTPDADPSNGTDGAEVENDPSANL